jgi:threonine/homoserine/homoserine lactone efflux protein
MGIQNFWVFAFATLVLNLTPGNDMIYVATRSLGNGVRTGIISGLGISIGILFHTIAAVLGLSILIAQSQLAFIFIKIAGAGYLIYLGCKSFFSKSDSANELIKAKKATDMQALKQGIITCVLNPKVGIFFLAFLPQFANPASSFFHLQLLLLGFWFIFSGTVVNIFVAIMFGKMGSKFLNKPGYWKWQGKITGLILVGLGLKVLFTKTNFHFVKN